jgi:hypothetical protein
MNGYGQVTNGFSPMSYCNPCITKGAWSAGGGIYYLQPRWGSNPGLVTGRTDNTATQNFDFHGRAAPTAYASYTLPNGLGFRSQWFYLLDLTAGPYASGPIAATPTAGFQSLVATMPTNNMITAGALAMVAVDWEVTKTIYYSNCSYLLSGGVRYAHIGQGYAAALLGPTHGLLLDGHNFNGVGPTVAAQSRYAVPYLRGAGLYGRARGATLVGQQHNEIQSVYNGVTGASFSSANQIMPVCELEVGADYNYKIRQYMIFAQAGFVVQSWWGAGNTTNSTVTTLGSPNTSSFDNGILGLYGLRTTAGVSF